MDNDNTADNTANKNKNFDSVWVRLYELVDTDAPVSASRTDAAGTRTMTTFRAMGNPFEIEPVPRNIDKLCDKVKDKRLNALKYVDAADLVVYKFKEPVSDEINLPVPGVGDRSTTASKKLSVGDKVPLGTTSLNPLVVVAPAMTAITSTSTAAVQATEKENALAMEGALDRARKFVTSIMSDMEEIPWSNGMQVMRGVTRLEAGTEGDIVIRRITEPFWKECLRVVNEKGMRRRVCAVGTPGIGKTTSTPFLLRMLLMQGHTVVYHVRTEQLRGWYYEFVPQLDNSVIANVYPERGSMDKIESLQCNSTFYIVDPGKTKDSCDLDDLFQPKLMIVASPDEGHWGGSEFRKDRGIVLGIFRVYPMWDLEELQLARAYLSTFSGVQLTADVVEARFRQVGGVPRHIFSSNFNEKLQIQDEAIVALTNDQVIKIAQKEMNAVGSFAPGQPKSAIIGYAKSDGNPQFSMRIVEIISPLVAEKVFVKFMKTLWDTMLTNEYVGGWKILETYCRVLMAGPAQDFQRRSCCGVSDNMNYPNVTKVALGGCTEIRMVPNIVNSAKEHPMILFHSTNPRQPLIDFIYKDSDGTFHAFQATMDKSHKAKETSLKELRKQLGASTLELYFLVPEERFNTFVTNPVTPAKNDASTHVWHVLVPKPNGNQTFTRQDSQP